MINENCPAASALRGLEWPRDTQQIHLEEQRKEESLPWKESRAVGAEWVGGGHVGRAGSLGERNQGARERERLGMGRTELRVKEIQSQGKHSYLHQFSQDWLYNLPEQCRLQISRLIHCWGQTLAPRMNYLAVCLPLPEGTEPSQRWSDHRPGLRAIHL